MIKRKTEQLTINKRIIHSNSSPLLFETINNNSNKNAKNQFLISKINNFNKNINIKKKLSPLITTNFKKLNQFMKNKKISIIPYESNSINSIKNKIQYNLDDGQKTLRLRGELANEDANNVMNKYFYPDLDEYHEKSNKINEEIDINKIMTFYTKIKYNKEKEEIKKIIQKQQRDILFNSKEEKNDNNYYNKYKLISSSSTRSIFKKNISLDSYDTFNNEHYISKNNFIRLDVSKKIYHSPLHSLDTMKKNKIIYDYILKNYNNNRIKSYKCLEDKLRPILKLKFNPDKNNQNNIKILPIIPKMSELNYLSTNKDEEESNNNNNNNHNNYKSKKNKNEKEESNKEILLDFSKIIRHKKDEKYLLKNKMQYPNKNFPESRSEFIFVQEGREFILHGGYNVSRKYNLWKFNPNQNTWTSIEPIGIHSEIRYAHTGVLHYRNLYIFGGKNFRGISFADLEIFNLDKKNWIFPKLESNKVIPLRRNHIACGVGNTMFVHGGINEENKYLDDQYILNYKPLRWDDVDINDSIKLPPLAHHSCCLVIPEMIMNNAKFNIYNLPDMGRSRMLDNIKEKGIYIFGGKISDEGQINNNLYVLKIGKKPLEYTIIKTYGNQPCGRYDSSLNFYERGNMIIVHGGRTINGKHEKGLNDTFILDLFSFNWIEVEYFNKECKVLPRYFHQAIIIKGELYIFGGINKNKYIGSEMLVLDLNSNTKCIKEKNEALIQMNKKNKFFNNNKNIDNKDENNYINDKKKKDKSKNNHHSINNDNTHKIKKIKFI